MLKNISKLGSTLNKFEQKSIQGGRAEISAGKAAFELETDCIDLPIFAIMLMNQMLHFMNVWHPAGANSKYFNANESSHFLFNT